MTYYHIKKYLEKQGLRPGQADHVRKMIRQMLDERMVSFKEPKLSSEGDLDSEFLEGSDTQ